MMWTIWLLLAALLALAAIVSVMRACLTALSGPHLIILERLRSDRAAEMADLAQHRREDLLWILTLIENCAKVGATALAAALIFVYGDARYLAAAIVAALCLLAVGPLVVKRIAAEAPERLCLAILPLLRLMSRLAHPIHLGVGRLVGYIPGIAPHSVAEAKSLPPNLASAATADIHLRSDEAERKDRAMLGGLLNLSELVVSDVMIHRTKMVTIDAAAPPDEIISAVLKSGHTRLPIFRDRPDNILGILNARDLFAALQEAAGDASRIDVEKIAKPAWYVPDTRPISDQLNAFLRRKTHFALVVDEYGEVMGLITLEDILEEIVGDIVDEHDAMASGVRRHADGSFTIDGTVPIRDLNRALEWDLPDSEATTLAGLVIHETRTIPDAGQTFTFHGFRFEVLRKRRHQVTSVRVTPIKRPEQTT